MNSWMNIWQTHGCSNKSSSLSKGWQCWGKKKTDRLGWVRIKRQTNYVKCYYSIFLSDLERERYFWGIIYHFECFHIFEVKNDAVLWLIFVRFKRLGTFEKSNKNFEKSFEIIDKVLRFLPKSLDVIENVQKMGWESLEIFRNSLT